MEKQGLSNQRLVAVYSLIEIDCFCLLVISVEKSKSLVHRETC